MSRNKSSSFNATSRDAWATAHASKTNPPDVGKYKPKFNQVEKIAPSSQIIAEPRNFGNERILTRDLQHTFFCDKVLHTLNDRRNPGKRKYVDNENSKITIENKDGDEDEKDKTHHAITGENLLSLNIGDEAKRMGTPSQAGSTRRGDLMVAGQFK